MTRKSLYITFAVLLALFVFSGAGAVYFAKARGKSDGARYLTQTADTGPILRVISASGALNPVNQVQVGTQISGTIKAIHVDFNAPVKVNQLLAEIDTATLDADLAQAQALLRSTQASHALAQTTLVRNRDLFDKGFISRADVDQAQSAVQTSKAAVDQQQAAINKVLTSLKNAKIRSPVAGTVTSREVAVGQTVAASLNTPVLFKIAQDLREMQIEANVAEADVGAVKERQKVGFTVDAFPGRTFTGVVSQIRNNFTVQQNVVTYTVIITARNDTLELRPGMTGYVRVTVGERDNIVRIPNAALRYEPPKATPSGSVAAAPDQAARTSTQRKVWRMVADGGPQPVDVTLGLTDGRFTELVQGDIKAGDALVIGQPAAGPQFGPKIF